VLDFLLDSLWGMTRFRVPSALRSSGGRGVGNTPAAAQIAKASVGIAGGNQFVEELLYVVQRLIIYMCGRYLITSTPEAMRQLFKYLEQPTFPPRYNVAPTQPIPIVRLHEGKRQFALVRWGLIPAWVKDPKTFSLLLQARSDSVLDKPSFKNAMKRRRCLIPADGFYEWNEDTTPRRPYVVRPKHGGPVAFAGLWESWMGPNGEELETAVVITTEANKTLHPIHYRMPAVIAPEAFDLWLDCLRVDANTAAALLVPAPEDLFEAYEISPAVNRVTNDYPDLLKPVKTAGQAANSDGAESAKANPPVKSAPAKAPRKRKTDDRQSSLF
jgi:putative SOS response-associated peptidase YedK